MSTDEKINLPASKLPSEPDPGDFRSSLHWRVFRILAELVNGWQFLADFDKTVSFFGSARFEKGNPWYEEAYKLANMLSKEGFTIVTGGGPGIMEAANKGGKEAGGESIGLNIELSNEQRINPFVNKSIAFHYFFVRKLMLSYSARAYIFFPGGFGTLDEAFEILTLVQTKKISDKIPIVLVGKSYWEPMHKWFQEHLFENMKTVDKKDLEIYRVAETAEEAFEIVKNAPPRKDFFY